MRVFQQFSIRSLIAALMIISAPAQVFAQSSAKRSSCDIPLDQQVSIIRDLYGQLMGVDAMSVQISLKEADLYRKPVSYDWSPTLAEAFISALDWSHSRESCWTFSTPQDVIDFAVSTRNALFNEDSGLSSQPFDGAFMLVVASTKNMDEAVLNANRLEATLSRADFPGRVTTLNSLNGWISVTAGMYTQQGCKDKVQELAAQGLIKRDAYCAPIARFDPMNWSS